ncbi:VWA domain-containing protein [Microbacterium sp. 4R-513]|uniref:VWA domain-containing protein n=1 Tax=Microbacterium sp. 4R-513 TaxID=2567934 RepID=UPI0013E1DFA1|nr:VWA domain-containing protein [Microbacterium sp. 4R-513]QIG38594.1 VWA domain-containing protein [Microbacterium sp. 4R-513]
MREERERQRKLTLRHRWYAGGIATLLSGALIFSGVAPAMAETTPPPDDTATQSATPPAGEATPPAGEATPPADDPAPPADQQPAPTPEESAPADPAPTQPAIKTPELIPSDRSVSAEQDAADVGVLLVPDPGPTTAVITVKVGSDRTGITGVTNLAGVVLLLNTGTNSPSGTRPDGVAGTADGWAKCTSDAQGDCSFTVPNTQPGGANRDARYWVIPSSVPAGYFANPSLRTGGSSGAGDSTPYRFRTGTQLRANTTYSSQNANDFMLSSGITPTASGGIWQQSRNNPTLAASCGLDVALILDLSGSVAPSVNQLKAAANTFVDSLQGTPSRMALFSFSSQSPATGANANFPALTSVSTAAQGTAFKARYAAWSAGDSTNWDRGLGVAAAANSPANNFDVAVIITDGNPTSYNQPAQGSGSDNRFRETENGIFSANALKAGPAGAAPTRVLAFGVGDGATGANNALNLRAISGPTAYNGSNGAVADYYQTADYSSVGTALRNLALGNCEGTLTVTKQIVPNTTPVGQTTGAVPAGAGWQFTGTVNTAGVTTPNQVQTTTANGTGTVSYPLTFPGGTTSASVTVVETQQPGFALQPVGGQNAVCTNLNTNTPVVPTANPALGFTVSVPSTQAVNCVIYNRAPNPPADLTVSKTWVVNGVTYADGAQPGGLSSQLQITGPGAAGATDQGWGVTRTGYTQGDSATLTEQVSLIDPTLCTNSAAVTSVNGAPTSTPLGAGYNLALSQVHNTATITNTVTCRSTLTLVKQVQGGNAAPTLWTLNAQSTVTPAPLPFAPGTTGVTHDVTPDARYQLFETGGDPAYRQTDNRTNLQSNPLSTGSATCIRVEADGDPWPGSGFSDGINGGVNVPLGYRVACTFTNQTAALTLLKNVVNDNGGSAAAPEWDLTATPAPLAGLSATTVPGSETEQPSSTFGVRPVHVYTLTESDVPGYQFSRLQQRVNGTWVDVVANPDPAGYPRQNGDGDWMITVGPLDDAVYRFVNDDIAPRLTLVKTVVNDNGGTATSDAWTLTATTPGGPELSGKTDTAAVTDQPVRAGVVYTIGESGGPAAYVWNSLECTGFPSATPANPTLTLSPGDDVTCTLNNDDILVPVTVDKADGTVEQLADGTWRITYEVIVANGSATLPTTYSLTDTPQFDTSFTVLTQGWANDPDVTDVAIEAGGTDTYTYVVTAEATTSPVAPTALVCSPTNGGGFFNSATVTFPGGTDSDTGCAVPGAPTVQKIAQTAVQNGTTGEWTLRYLVTVSNPTEIPLAYTLSDTAAALPAGVTGGAWAASDPTPVGGGTFVRNAGWAGSGELATGTLPPGATHTYTVTRTVSVAASVPDSALTCGSVVGQGGGVWNTASVTNGITVTDSSDCADIDRPDVTIAKTVTGTKQLVDGTWEIVYDVVVTNPSAALAAVYSLADTLQFGGDIAVVDASWTGPTSGTFTAGTATLATDRVLAASGVETYTVTAHATIDQDAWDGDTVSCTDQTPPTAGGFLNVATVTVNGVGIPADDCSTPELPTVQKEGVSATQDPDDPAMWTVSYDVTVTSGGYDTFYSLSDTPAFAAGITLGTGSAQRTDIASPPITPITPGTDFVTGVALPAGATHVYRVTWTVEVTDAFVQDDGECTGEPGSGFFNTATLLVGDIPIDGTDCIPVDERVYPTITKTVTGTEQDPATGRWTVTYDIVVNLAPTGPSNPKGLAAKYDLTDTLDFGGDITVNQATWSGESSGSFDPVTDPADLASGKAIAAGATHTYTVTAVATVTAAAIDGGTTSCDAGEGESGGFLNTALLSSGGEETPVEACAEPVFPRIVKSAAGPATQDPDTGDWTLEYDITVTYPTTAADPRPSLSYVLTDVPDLPDNVELQGDWTAIAATADTPDPDNATFDGDGTWTIVNAGFDPDADGITTHVFTISAVVSVTGPPVGPLEECDELESAGIVVFNTGTVTSGEYTADDDACQVVTYDDVGVAKTSELPDDQTSVEPGDQFEYVITVTNNGTGDATNVIVFDDSLSEAPYAGRVQLVDGTLSVEPAGLAYDDDSDLPGNVIDLTIDQLGVGESATIRVTAEFLPAPHTTDPEVPPGDEPPAPVPPLDSIVNLVCVAADFDGDPANNCDDDEVPTRDLTATLYATCQADAPLLGWVVTKSELLRNEDIDFTWTPDDGTPTTDPASVTLTHPGGDLVWANVIPWPGAVFTPNGVSIDYPGWRPIRLTDIVPGSDPINYRDPETGLPMTPQQRVDLIFNGLILDNSELDYAWRGPSTVTIQVNPTLTFETGYPPATPECFVARHTEVQIEKTASVERTEPGKSFTYTMDVRNVSDDSAAEGIVVTDAIPTSLKVTNVTWAERENGLLFPTWREDACGVTGQNSAGYGGTLTCELFGPLMPANFPNGGRSVAPQLRVTVLVNPATTASVINNVGVVDYHTFGDPEDTGRDADDATVLLSGLPVTGGSPAVPLLVLGFLALLGGVTTLVIVRRRRGEPKARL